MPIDKTKVKRFIKVSKEVLEELCLENGAIVAGNSGNPVYSKDTPNYMYVWPRDSAFICMALNILGLRSQTERFFEWCFERAIDKEGLLWQRYTPNGLPEGFFIREIYKEKKIKELAKYIHPNALYQISEGIRSQLQPDGNGLILWALKDFTRNSIKAKQKFRGLAARLADGICSIWEVKGYKYLIHGPWEEKIAFPGVNFTYTIAISIKGLKCAAQLCGSRKKWTKTGKQMEKTIHGAFNKKGEVSAIFGENYKKAKYKEIYSNGFSRGKFDPEVDSSLLFLVWPGELLYGGKALEQLVKKVDKKGGIIRYPGDSYDGVFIKGNSLRKGGNAWTLLNFWAAICLSKVGEKDRARNYYEWVLDRVDDYIPEQITDKGEHRGPSPLAWSHAMFVIASKELGYLK